MIDDYGTQITADSNVQLDSDTTLYARYGTGFTSYTSYWKAPGVLHIDIDNVEHYPTYRIAAFRGNESLKDAVILPDIIDASDCQIDLDIKYAGVPFDEQGFKFQLIPAKEDGTCLFTPQEVAGSYSWYDNLGDEEYMKNNFNVTYNFKVQDPESENGYDTYFSIRALKKDVGKTIGEMTLYNFSADSGYVEAEDKSFIPPAKEGYEFVGWYSEEPAEDMVYDDTNRGEQITTETALNVYGPNERTYYAHFRKIDDVERAEVKADTADNNITLTWNAVNNAESYNIYKMNDNDEYVLISSAYANNASSFDYTDKDVKDGNTYTYMIKPNSNGSEGIGTVIEVSYGNSPNPGPQPTPTPEPSEVKKGDVNNDGEVNLSDVVKTLKAALGIETLTEEEAKAADVDGDNKVSLNDAKMILQAALGIIKL